MPALLALLHRVPHVWRRSLQARIVASSLALSSLALVAVFGYMSVSVSANLFESRRDEALLEATRANQLAQQVFDESIVQSLTGGEMDALRDRALDAVASVIANRAGTEYAMFRSDGQESSSLAMDDVQSQAFDDSLLTDALRESVASSSGEPYYQSVRLITEQGTQPGLLVGTILDVPRSGRYEFYLLSSFASAQSTLQFMQLTMLLGGLALITLIGLITWLVVRMVVGPVQVAASTAERFAAGELDVRIPIHGDDELATLGRSYNEMADSIGKQIQELATLSTVQQRFVSDVSHELRTPLTTIRLAGDVLHDRKDAFDPVAGRTVELLHAQIERFEQLLADLLELSRFDAGAAQLEIEPTNLVRLAEREIDAMQPLAHERGSELRLVAPGGHFEAEVDPRRIRRILQNLLGNAIDHGEGRPITVTVDSTSEAAGIAVRDHGIGMTAAETGRVFDRFWRADPSRQRRTGGTGLGLAISRDDAALHGGWIDVWSEPGQGTAFRLTLPRAGSTIALPPIDLPPADTRAMTTISVPSADVPDADRGDEPDPTGPTTLVDAETRVETATIDEQTDRVEQTGPPGHVDAATSSQDEDWTHRSAATESEGGR